MCTRIFSIRYVVSDVKSSNRSLIRVKVAAEESVLQMIIRPALEDLKRFIEAPTEDNAAAMNSIPVLYRVLKDEKRSDSRYSEAMLDVCKWMLARGKAVLEALMVHQGPPPKGLGDNPPGQWNKVRLGLSTKETY